MLQALSYRRLALVAGGFLLALLLLEARLLYLQILIAEDLAPEITRRHALWQLIEPTRGEIRTRQGEVRAGPYPVKLVYANTRVCTNRLEDCARIFAARLNLDRARVLAQLRSAAMPAGTNSLKEAVLLKRNVPEPEWRGLTNSLAGHISWMTPGRLTSRQKRLLKRLRYQAVFAEDEQMRAHPVGGNGLAHVTGHARVRAEGRGLEGITGIEKQFDSPLAGVRGLCSSSKDASGRELLFLRKYYVPPQDGHHVVLTIDSRLQEICETSLASAYARHGPKSATVLIMRVKTGEVLAWATMPPPHVSNPGNSPPEAVSNHAISDIYEFGSATKALMLAIALEEGCISPDAPISCGNGVFRHGRAEVYDPRSVGVRTMREATIRSVNLPFARLGPKLGKERLLRYLTNFGLGSVTGIALPGEVRGQVETNLNNWTDFTLTRVPFGQGIGCTQLQLTRAFCAIGNKGQLMEPRVVSHIEAVDGRLIERFPPKCVRTVVSPRTCEITLDLLTGPVERKGGTARAAALATHTVAGKTGTGQVSDGHVYLKDVHTCSFLGLTPAKDPELCISVVFDRCGPGRTGGGVAAPVFREIAAQAVEWLGIPPDKLEDNKRPPALARPGTKQPAASALAATRR